MANPPTDTDQEVALRAAVEIRPAQRRGFSLNRCLATRSAPPRSTMAGASPTRSNAANILSPRQAPGPASRSLTCLPIVRSGKVALVSTANKALQEQLFYKDIPFVQQHVTPFDAALVKGMGNYLCLDRLAEEQRIPAARRATPPSRGWKQLAGRLRRVGRRPRPAGPSPCPPTYACASPPTATRCAWRACPHFGDCYVREMRDRSRARPGDRRQPHAAAARRRDGRLPAARARRDRD